MIRVYDYFMRGNILPQQQVFTGHSVYAERFVLQNDMRFLYSVGPNNGIFKWAFFGDKNLPDEPPLNEYFEKTQREQERKAAENNKAVTIPTWDENDLQTYTEDQLG
jgi:hypothetical protein